MTGNEIKEMLKDIINNGAEYEYRWMTPHGWSDWKPYKLGYEICDRYEYRKVEKWYVVKEANQTFTICPYEKAIRYNPIHFEGTKESCEKWIEEHRRKTWLEELNSIISPHAKGLDFKVKRTATEVCKKILEEVEKYNENCPDIQECGIYIEPLENIITDLGVEV